MRFFYQAISYLFFPGTLAIVGFASILVFTGRDSSFSPLLLPAIMFLIGPVVPLLIMLRTGLVSDIHVTRRSQRLLSYTFAIAFAFFYVWISRGEHPLWWHWGAAVCITLVFLLLVNTFWLKASAHMAGTGGYLVLTLTGLAHGQSWIWVAVAAAIAGLVYAARKGLKAHTHYELIVGFALGFGAAYLSLRF